MLDEEHNELYFPYSSEKDPEIAQRLARLRFSAELEIAVTALKSGRALKVDNAQNDPRLYHVIDKPTALITRNVLAAPLSTRQGTIGVAEVVNRRGVGKFGLSDVTSTLAICRCVWSPVQIRPPRPTRRRRSATWP